MGIGPENKAISPTSASPKSIAVLRSVYSSLSMPGGT